MNAFRQDHNQLPSIRILVVEDNEALAMGLERYLVSAGHSVSTADSVKAAVNCVKSGEFDLLLVDLQLRDGTGWDLLENLKTRNPVRAIAMSGWGGDSDLAKSKAIGFGRHLVKPVTPEELAEAILEVMNHPPAKSIKSVAEEHRPQKRGRESNSTAQTETLDGGTRSQKPSKQPKAKTRSNARSLSKRKL